MKIENVAYNLTDKDIVVVQDFLDTKFKSPMPAKVIYQAVKDKLEGKAVESETEFGQAFGANVRAGVLVGVEGKKRVGCIAVPRVEPKVRPQGSPPGRRGTWARAAKDPLPAEVVVKPKSLLEETLGDLSNDDEPVVVGPARSAEFWENLSSSSEDEAVVVTQKPVNKPTKLVKEETARPADPYVAKKEESRHARYVWVGRKMYKVPRSTATIESLIANCIGCKPSLSGDVVFSGRRYDCEHKEILERMLTSFLFGQYKGESEPVLDDESGLSVELRIASGMTHVEV